MAKTTERYERGTSIVLACACRHAYQDSVYGPGKRLHNIAKNDTALCTVCNAPKSVAPPVVLKTAEAKKKGKGEAPSGKNPKAKEKRR